ncbi:asparaginase [Streptomyces sp. NPDC004237]|uniref:asparaginase n=1 Tax=Streptomyces sp. NPDC004237 TaxID=3154455 RepID=UPI0033A36E61
MDSTAQPTAPPVKVVALGGTVSMTPSQGASGGVAPQLTAADLVASVPELEQEAVLELPDVRRVPGAWLQIDEIAELAQTFNEQARSGEAAGFVVTQGTDTLEEVAFLLDLLYEGSAPVVVTGAMRNPTTAGADGPANLLAAVRTAASADARDLGVLVVFSDEIHAARHASKVHTTSTHAFASPNAGPIGHVVEGRPRLHFTIRRHSALHLPFVRPATVETMEATLGSNGELLRAVGRYVDGLVVAGFGAGHVPKTWVDPLEELAAQMPVVLSSRTGAGSVLTATYGYAGSESDLLKRGLIDSRALGPRRARLLLMSLLRAGASSDEIRTEFTVRT